MLAWVKSMQSFARLLAVGIGLGALRDMSRRMSLEPDNLIQGPDSGDLMAFNRDKLVIDRVTRCVIGIALIPAAIAIISRLTIPETPRYYVDIVKDLRRAVKKALKVYPKRVSFENPEDASPVRQDSIEFSHWYKGMYNYLDRNKKARRNLILITVLWGLMDAGFYGMSLDSYTVLATLSTSQPSTDQNSSAAKLRRASSASCTDNFSWRPSSEPTTTNLYQTLDKSAIRSLEIVSIASVVGSLFAILIVNYYQRKRILFVTFLASAVLFAITGATLLVSKAEQHHTVTIAFYAITQFVYNVGPNTLIFIIAAEIFPTVYRGTFYGIAAAGGKIGAITIRAISGRTGNDKNALSIRLLACIPLMLLAACLSLYLPDVQIVPQQVDAEKTRSENNQANRDEPASSGALPQPNQPASTQEGGPQIPLANLNRYQATSTAANNPATVHGEPTPSMPVSSQVQQKRRKNARRFLPRLENMALEDIAPNPSFPVK
jgi:PHS family inorganic phosphate transporter-like MFS transporter